MANAQKIAAKFNIDIADAEQIADALEAGDGFVDIRDDLFETMFDFYVVSGEMPYDVASRGDPYQWIDSKLSEELAEDEKAVWIDYDDTSVRQRQLALDKGETSFYVPVRILTPVQKAKYVRN